MLRTGRAGRGRSSYFSNNRGSDWIRFCFVLGASGRLGKSVDPRIILCGRTVWLPVTFLNRRRGCGATRIFNRDKSPVESARRINFDRLVLIRCILLHRTAYTTSSQNPRSHMFVRCVRRWMLCTVCLTVYRRPFPYGVDDSVGGCREDSQYVSTRSATVCVMH